MEVTAPPSFPAMAITRMKLSREKVECLSLNSEFDNILSPVHPLWPIAETLDGGKTSCCGQGCVYALLMKVQFHWILSCLNRKKLRSKYGLPDEPCCDCCVHYCCEPCALCQEYAELKHRGLDPSQGSTSGPPKGMFMFR